MQIEYACPDRTSVCLWSLKPPWVGSLRLNVRNFLYNFLQIFRFCRSKCHKNFKMKRNPRKVKWTKAYRKLHGKDMTQVIILLLTQIHKHITFMNIHRRLNPYSSLSFVIRTPRLSLRGSVTGQRGTTGISRMSFWRQFLLLPKSVMKERWHILKTGQSPPFVILSSFYHPHLTFFHNMN